MPILDLGLGWFVYVGSNKETTREFCEVLKEKKYVHISEIPEIVKGHIDGHKCEIYPRTGLPKGMIEGTNADNFQVNNGGWNCGHKLIPVAVENVPEIIKQKFDIIQKLKEYKNVKSEYKPSVKEKGVLKLDLTLGVKDLAKNGIDELIKGWYEHKKDSRKHNILKAIISKKEFIEHKNLSTKDNSIYIFGKQPYNTDLKITNKEYFNNIKIAQKLLKDKCDVYMIPNIKGNKSADFIILKKNGLFYYEGKSIDGKGGNLKGAIVDGLGQSDRIVVDISGTKDISMISSTIKKQFDSKSELKEIIVYNGSNRVFVDRDLVSSKEYYIKFRKRWVGKK